MKFLASLRSASLILTGLAALCSSAKAQDLILTEILSNEDSAGADDFWELTNTGTTTIDLSGWSWDDDSRTADLNVIPDDTLIGPGESIVFTKIDAATFRAWWGIGASVQVISNDAGPGFGKNDGIALFDDSDTEVFFFSYAASGFTTTDGSDSSGDHAGLSAGGSLATQSLVIDPTFGFETPRYTFADGAAFGTFVSTIETTDIGSPGVVSGISKSASLILTELLSNESYASGDDYWELTNIGYLPVDLSGWSWDDDSRTADLNVVPADTVIAANESIIFTALDAATFRAWWGIDASVQVISNDAGPGFGKNDGVALFDASDAEVFFFSYAASGFTKSDGSDSSGDHAGLSAGGSLATQSLVIDPGFGVNAPRFTFADGINNGTTASALDAADFGSPGSTGLSSGGPSFNLTLSITPASFLESATNPAAVGTVTRSGNTTGDLVISLSSSDESEVIIPATVTIADGEASANFDVTAVDDSFPDNEQGITITATATDAFPGTFELAVQDDGDTLGINVLLTEILSNESDSAPDGADDFWELTNFGNEPADISGYTWHDSGRSAASAAAWALPDESSIAAGESVIFTEADPAVFRSWWGLDSSVQVFQSVGAPGLGKSDGVSFFDQGGNEIFFFSYAPGDFTLEDGNLSTLDDHAGIAAGGSEAFQSAIWVPGTGTATPRYTAATGSNYGSFTAPGAGDIGSPGRVEAPISAAQSISIADTSVSEGDSGSRTLSLVVTRTDTATAFTVDYAVTGGSATADADFAGTTGTLIFDLNGPTTRSIDVTILGDTLVESDETIIISLDNLVNTTGATEISAATGTATILNDDLIAATFPPSMTLGFSKASSITLTGAEIPAFDPASKRAFTSSSTGIQVIDLTDPANPVFLSNISLTDLGLTSNAVSSIAVRDGILAACAIANPKTNDGVIAFINAATGALLGSASVGSNPDQLTFTPDGTKVLVANEAELVADPADDVTPGTVSIVDISGGYASPVVTTAGFAAFNAQADALIAAGVRIFEGGTPEFDFEPEYIAIAPDGLTAMVVLQEANAVATLDIATATFTSVIPLGEKDFSNLMADFSDRDSASGSNLINPAKGHPVFGLYMPDGIASYASGGQTYFITANEGDDRDDFLPNEETIRVGEDSYDLDDTLFPNETDLKQNSNLGRLTVSNSPGLRGDTDGDGDIDRILAFGGRSFSILDDSGTIVFDSGDMIETIVASSFQNNFDDGRSDNKGPEPEGVIVVTISGRNYAFIGLERSHMVLVFDVTDPAKVTYVNALLNPGDENPEGMAFVSASDSPSDKPLLLVANEVSNTLTIYELTESNPLFTLELLHASDQEASAAAVADAPRFSAVLNALRAQDIGSDNTLTLSSGDAIIPGIFYAASGPVYGTGGIADIQIQNELGFQAIALGNHEFDFGTGPLAALISGSATGNILDADFTGANFPYLSGNLDISTDANMAPLAVADGGEPMPNSVTGSIVIDLNGQKIGVVGATTPTLGTISSPGGVTIAPTPFDGVPTSDQLDALAALIQQDIDALLSANEGLNKIVLLTHMQDLNIERGLARRLKDVDIIVGGGSNTRLLDSDDRLRAGDSKQGEYPEWHADANGKITALVNTDGSYKYVGRLVLDFNTAGDLIPSSYNPAISGAFATDDQGVEDLAATELVDPEIQRIVDEIEAQIVATESNVFGVADVFLNGNRSGVEDATDPDGVRTQETNLGNLTADANLFEARKTDPSTVISIKNGGGIRASIGRTVVPTGTTFVRLPNEEIRDGDDNIIKPAGGISQNDIATSLAFNNALSLLTVTTQQLVDLLEHGVGAVPAANGRFPQIGGMTFSYDPSLEPGSRVRSLALIDDADEVTEVLVKNGAIVGNPAATYRLVTLSFLADGGDGYPFPTSEAIDRIDLAQEGVQTGDATFADDGTEQDALAEYLANRYNSGSAFTEDDLGRSADMRIQNLGYRSEDVAPRTVFDDWAEKEEFENLDLSDPNGHISGNALTNFALFAFDLDPNVNHSGRDILISGSSITQRSGLTLVLEETEAGTQFSVIYLRRKDAAELGLTYTLEFGSESQTWAAPTPAGTEIGSDLTTEAIKVAFPATLQNGEEAIIARLSLALDTE